MNLGHEKAQKARKGKKAGGTRDATGKGVPARWRQVGSSVLAMGGMGDFFCGERGFFSCVLWVGFGMLVIA